MKKIKKTKAIFIGSFLSCLLFSSTAAFANVYVFVSFSMPDETLKSYFIESNKANAALVMRGLVDDSFAATKEKLDELNIAYSIDPELFEKYQITRVPTIVDDDGYTVKKITGNIKLFDVLQIFDEEQP